MFVYKNKIIFFILLLFILIVLDQITKILIYKFFVSNHLLSCGDNKNYGLVKIVMIPNIINIIYRENYAAIFSFTSFILRDIRIIMLIWINIFAIIFFIIYYYYLKTYHVMINISYLLVLSGASSNLIDRIRLGYVVDFIDIYMNVFQYGIYHFATFNLADSFILCGCILFIMKEFYYVKKNNDNMEYNIYRL